VGYDPTSYLGCAPYYLQGRPPYSDLVLDVLTRELHLDGSGQLLDVGCGPGVLAVELAGGFARVTGLDPDPAMLEEARRHAAQRGVTNAEWITARAEDIPRLHLGPLRVATFGQSFHWTDREVVADGIFELLEPGGAIVLITHDIDAGPAPEGPGHPPIPDEEIQAIIRRYLGPARLSGQGLSNPPVDRYEDALARTRFGVPRTVHAPGRVDVVRDVEGVIAGYLSMSYAAPHLFGERLGAFVDDVRAVLRAHTTTGRFWDWPGDTALLIAVKPGG
jgi:SAM-dependent methyltransferase